MSKYLYNKYHRFNYFTVGDTEYRHNSEKLEKYENGEWLDAYEVLSDEELDYVLDEMMFLDNIERAVERL
jgi:hypothetical protein